MISFMSGESTISPEVHSVPSSLYPAKIEGLIGPLPKLQHRGFQFYQDSDGSMVIKEEGGFLRIAPLRQEAKYFPIAVLPQPNLQMIKTHLVKMADQETDNIVAAKTAFTQSVLKEAEVLSVAAHPNIVALLNMAVSGKERNDLYLIMEWLPGGTLENWILAGSHSLDEVASIFGQTSSALSHINKKGYIYADAKPANIMFTAEGQVKIVDFENSCRMDENGDSEPDIFCFSTYEFASPEQIQLAYTNKGRLHIQSDVYSLAAVLFEMLTNQPTILGKIDRDLFVNNPDLPIPLRPEYQAVMPLLRQKRLAEILRKALAVDYQKRQPNIEILNAEVQEVLLGSNS